MLGQAVYDPKAMGPFKFENVMRFLVTVLQQVRLGRRGNERR